MPKFEIMVIIFALCAAATAKMVVANGDCPDDENIKGKTTAALHLKIGAIVSILVASILGLCVPVVGRSFKALQPDKDVFFVIKAFAAGVILSTGFVHILPEAFEFLSSECLKENPWLKFPFAGFVSMMAAVCTFMIDALAMGYYERVHASVEQNPDIDIHVEVNESQTQHHGHGHRHGYVTTPEDSGSSLIRHRVISQVLELGIVAHSVINGIVVGVSGKPSTIRPLFAALTFHQFFEGIALGGCFVLAAFSRRSTAIMGLLFALTTPFGIALGIAISSRYNENSPTALTVKGLFDAASGGILIYMALVDLLAQDFISKRMQSNVTLQLWSYTALFLGIGSMSLLATWA